MERFVRNLVRPGVVFAIVAALVALFVVTIGQVLLHLHVADKPELRRWDLWVGTGWALLILGVAAFFNALPKTSGRLEQVTVVGRRSMFDVPEDIEASTEKFRRGRLGSVKDIQPDDTIYTRSGLFARVIGLVPGSEEHGVRFKGYIYAKGLSSGTAELWIPLEAVSTVYPETHAVFLAIKGDETLTFGWDKPPAHFSREPRTPSAPKAI